MTTPAKVKEADIMRALRSAKKVGAKRVIVGADGSIDIWFEGGPPIATNSPPLGALPDKPTDAEYEAAMKEWREGRLGGDKPPYPIRIREFAKKRLKLF